MTAAPLPPPRDPGATPASYRIALVCLGNICRSPMAHVVLEHHLREAGLADRVRVDSFGTGGWHVGGSMDERAAQALRTTGHDPSRHRARQVAADGLGDYDLILAMDSHNLAALRQLDPDGRYADRMALFGDHDPDVGDSPDVPDPYYGGPQGFSEVLAIVDRTARALASRLAETL